MTSKHKLQSHSTLHGHIKNYLLFLPLPPSPINSLNSKILWRERETGRGSGGERGRERVTWCSDPSQPLGIISELKETFIKRYTVERTNKAEIRPGEQSEKTESCRERLWNETQSKGP